MSQVPSTPYQSVGVYDAPGMILSQLAGGVASFGAVKNTLLDPQRLTPEERKSVGDRVAPDSPSIVRRVIDTATNPLVLLMLMSYAPMGRMLKQGLDPFVVAAKNNPMVRKASMAVAAGLVGLNEATLGGSQSVIAHEFASRVEEVLGPSRVARQNAKVAFAKAHGVETLDLVELRKAPAGSAERKAHDALMAAHLETQALGDGVLDQSTSALQTRYHVGKKTARGQYMTDGTDGVGKEAVAKYMDAEAHLEEWKMTERSLYRKVEEATAAGKSSDEIRQLKRDAHKFTAEGLDMVPVVSKHATFDGEPDPRRIQMKIDLEGELARGEMRKLVDYHLAGSPEAREYVRATREHFDKARDFMFKLNEKGEIPPEQMAKLWSAVYEQRSQDGIVSTLESALGVHAWTGKAEQGPGGADSFFSPQHKRAWEESIDFVTDEEGKQHSYYKVVTPDGKPIQGAKESLVEMAKWAQGGPSMRARGHTPLNSYEPIPHGLGDRVKLTNTGDMQHQMERGRLTPGSTIIPQTDKQVMIHVEDLDGLLAMEGLSPQQREHLERLRAKTMDWVQHNARKGEMVLGARIDGRNVDRYIEETYKSGVLLEAPSQAELVAQKAMIDQAKEYHLKESGKPFVAGKVDPVTLDPVTGQGLSIDQAWLDHPERGLQTRLGMLRHGALSVEDPNLRNQTRTAYMGIMGRMDPQGLVTLAAHHQAKASMRGFLGSRLGQFISSAVPSLGESLKKLSDPETPLGGGASGFWGRVAGYLYTTHLGLNLGSMTINLMQPWTLVAPLMGAGPTLKGYGSALGDMWKYSQARFSKYGARMITTAERQAIIDEVVPHWKDFGIGASHLQALDERVYGTRLGGGVTTWDKVQELMLKGFEKTEIMNRLTAGHTYIHAAAGKVGSPTFKDEMRRFVETTQFGGHAYNAPPLFTKGVLSSPVLKQFLTFGARTATGIFRTAPMVGGQENYWKGLTNTLIRGAGMSAVIYEAGKGLFGTDLSRGLFVSGATDFFGGGRYVQTGNDWVPVPPVLAIPHDFISAVAQGDHAKLVDAVARTFPGGIAATRLMGVLPAIPVLGPELQKTTADWTRPLPDGRVAVYKDGRLVDFRSPSELVMRGLGVDMGKFNEPGALDGYLVKQRQEILGARQMWLAKWVSNDFRGAAAVKAEFEKRFKVPLTVTQQQVKQYIENRNVPRPERVLDKLPPEVRAQYAAMVAQTSSGLNVPNQSVAGAGTSGSRGGQRQRVFGQGAQPLPEGQQEAPAGTGLPFGGFGGF